MPAALQHIGLRALAQLQPRAAGLEIGRAAELRVTRLFEKYGLDTVLDSSSRILKAYTEARSTP